jgi:hypothetical protein
MGEALFRLVRSVPIMQVLNSPGMDGQWHYEICSLNRSSVAS